MARERGSLRAAVRRASRERRAATLSDGLNFESTDHNLKLKIGGRIENDWAFMTEDDDIRDAIDDFEEGTEFRRARLFVSGQLPLDPGTGNLAGDDIATQTRQAIENIRSILSAAGASLADVVKTTVFLQDMGHFAPMNQIYQEYFNTEPPARSCFEVARLPKDALVEIESIAVLKA